MMGPTKAFKTSQRLREIASEYNDLMHSVFATEAYLDKYGSKNRTDLIKSNLVDKILMRQLDKERQEIYENMFK